MEVIGQSLIAFTPTPFAQIPDTDWIFFYSKTGVQFFFENIEKQFNRHAKKDLSNFKNLSNIDQLKWAAIGKGTATALTKFNIKADFIGNGHPIATAADFLKIAKGKKVLFARAKTSKKSIQKLVGGKIDILDLIVYENKIKTDFDLPFFNFLVFTSPLNAQSYFNKYALQKGQKVVAIGQTTSAALNDLGIKKLIIAEKPTETALTKAILLSTTSKSLSTVNRQSLTHSNMSQRFAVIDLGTNTFHLLVVEKSDNHAFKAIHRQRFFVKLAEEGIETIGKAPIERGLIALKNFRKTLDEFDVKKVTAIGTAALRTATNGREFIKTVKENYNIGIQLIDGNREAELIYKGVANAVPLTEENHLIMDIGGGSVEFIIANKNELLWAQSFPIGVAVLHKKFHHSEPISKTEIADLQTFLNNFLTPLYQALIQYPTSILVGASGTFDVLEFILASDQKHQNHAFIKVEEVAPLHQKIIQSSKAERFALKEIPDTRADMIVVAMLLIDFVIKKVNIKKIIVSNFAMKEGILAELMG